MDDTVAVVTMAQPAIRRIELDRPWRWLEAGWRDIRRNPIVSFTYGALAALTGYALSAGILWLGWIYLMLPLVAGFLIIGPILTVGLYEASRRAEKNESTSLAQALAAWGRNGSQIALMGMALLLFMFAWIRLAALLFMLYYGLEPPQFQDLVVHTFLDPGSLPFLVLGTIAGAGLALLAFSVSVVSIPMLLDRTEMDVVTAMATSFRAVRANLMPLLFWALLIVVFIGAGLVTLYLGLIVTLPLIGHATWHAYRDLIVDEGRV